MYRFHSHSNNYILDIYHQFYNYDTEWWEYTSTLQSRARRQVQNTGKENVFTDIVRIRESILSYYSSKSNYPKLSH